MAAEKELFGADEKTAKKRGRPPGQTNKKQKYTKPDTDTFPMTIHVSKAWLAEQFAGRFGNASRA